MATALAQVGKPYVWGADSPRIGFDCSGLVTYAYQVHGVSVPHNSEQAWAAGQKVATPDLADPVFFHGSCSGSEAPPCHEAMYVGNGNVVVAPFPGARVEVRPMSSFGDYMGARSFLPSSGVLGAGPSPAPAGASASAAGIGCATLILPWAAVLLTLLVLLAVRF